MGQRSVKLGHTEGIVTSGLFLQWKKILFAGWSGTTQFKVVQLKREASFINGKEVGSYVYQEFGSKNRQGGFGSLNLYNKLFDNTRIYPTLVDVM